MYDPSVGRWLEEDPIEFAGHDVNLSRYVFNQPTHFTDSSGLVAVFFDGTTKTEKDNTSIYKLFKLSQEPADNKKYVESPLFWPTLNSFSKQADDAAEFVFKAWLKAAENDRVEPIDLFGWSRGAAMALAVMDKIDRLIVENCRKSKERSEFFMKHKFEYRFVGLIDPVSTAILGFTATSIPIYIKVLALLTRDGSKDTFFTNPFFVLFNKVKTERAKAPGHETIDKKYPLTHGETGIDDMLFRDLYKAAKSAGVPLAAL